MTPIWSTPIYFQTKLNLQNEGNLGKNLEMKYTTYAIKDPRDNVPVYVGQTSNIERRRKQYRNRIKKNKIPNYGTINITTYLVKLNRLGFEPIIEILDKQDTEERSLASETEWVRRLVSAGHPLLNRWKEHRAIVKDKFSSAFLKQYFSTRLE